MRGPQKKYPFYPEMYYSIHGYQSTENTKSHCKDFIYQSECGIKCTYHQIGIILQTTFRYVEFNMQKQQYFSRG